MSPVLEAPLFTYLGPELAALVGDRIYPKRSPEGAGLPYVIYERISAVRTYTFDPYPLPAWVRARMSFTCRAITMLGAIEVGEAVVLALSGFSGMMGSLNIGSARVANEADLYDETSKLYARVVDVFVEYEESI